MASRAWRSSSALICSKSFVRNTSRRRGVLAFKLDLVGRAFAPRLGLFLVEHRLGQPLLPGLLLVRLRFDAHLLEQQLHHLLDHLGPAPEHLEGVVKQRRVFAPLHEHRMQNPVEVALAGHAATAYRLQRIKHGARPDRQACVAQHASEVHDVGRELATGWRLVGIGCLQLHDFTSSQCRTENRRPLFTGIAVRPCS
jgi:hypothetical protein